MTRVLVGCESSGRVRDALRARGIDAVSCDLLPTKVPGPHLQMDVFVAIREHGPWDAGIFFPTCTYLCGSAEHWVKRGRVEKDGRPRSEHQREALQFVKDLWSCDIPVVVLENPVGRLSTLFMEPSQIIQPWMFGDDASKGTCLWIRGGLPLLKPTKFCAPRLVVHDGKWWMRWSNQTDSGQNNLPPTEDRWDLRSATYPGVADAMGDQWAPVLLASTVEDLV